MATFSGMVSSDFLKLASIDDTKKTDTIDFAATDFLSLRQALVKYIKASYPLDYSRFIESDQGMMLAELMSYVGAVASLKVDMLANENYLRTARKRSSVKKLLDLIGVNMKGPISAAANAKITWDFAGWAHGNDRLVISVGDRVKNITSAEDAGPLSYTLYKVTPNGFVDVANSQGSITLDDNESENPTDLGGDGNIFSNLVLLEGALAVEEGTFGLTETAKFVALQQSPVVEGSVEVFVQGGPATSGVYTKVDNVFFASGSTDKIYQVIYNDDYKATVSFGDNTFGQSPNTNDRYVITYRVGGGTRGNIPNEFLNVPIAGTLHPNSGPTVAKTGTLENVSQGTGGSDAETLEHAKKYGPLTFRRQDRLVTLPDIESFANSHISSYGSVGKATAATRRAYSSANIIDIYVLEKANELQLRRATPAFKSSLLAAMNEKKMLTDEFVVVDGLIRTMDLVVTISLDREFKPQEELIKLTVRNKILDHFKVDNRSFGQRFIPQDLNREIFNIPEVRFSSIDNISNIIQLDFNEIIQLNNFSINVEYV
tara:strand:+ start:2479 stop:4107 length:1629 start_codon:yes stop_codon:yes gene_type:complete